MTTRRNTFEGQSNGTAVSTGNSATSGDPLTGLTVNGGSIVYSTTHPGDGSVGIAHTQSGTAACFDTDASFNSVDIGQAFVFWYSGTPPTAATRILEFRTAAGLSAAVNLNTSGHLVVQNSAGSAMSGMTTASALSTGLNRIEIEVHSDASAGTAALRYYAGAQSMTAVESLSATAQNTRGGNITTVNRGIVSASNFGGTMYSDSYQTRDGSTTPIGPYPLNTAPTANAGTDQTGVAPYATFQLDGSGSSDPDGTVASYAWTQTAGTTTALDDATAQKPSGVAPATVAGDTLTYSLVVTDDDGATSIADTVDIVVRPHTVFRLDAGGPSPVQLVQL